MPSPNSPAPLIAALTVLVSASACTTLAPMPGMTMIDPVPESRPGLEAQAAVVPGFFLSDTVQQDPDADGIAQLSAFFEPDDLLSVEGLSAGARWVSGGDDSGYVEPMVRYRTFLDEGERISLAGVVYGTAAEGASNGAAYDMARGGAELVVGVRATPTSNWLELQLLGGGSLSAITGEGVFCMDATTGYGVDCGEGNTGDTTSDLSGVYPALFAGLSLDFGRHTDSALHDVRLGAYGGGGTMPRIRFAEQQDSPESWFGWGIQLSVGMGAAD